VEALLSSLRAEIVRDAFRKAPKHPGYNSSIIVWRCLVKALVWLLVLLSLFLIPVAGQHGTFPNPPPSMDSQGTPPPSQPPMVRRQVDFAELQKEAEDLARTAQTIPDDTNALRKGTLPKDFVQKLKHIEKLSKHLRSQVAP
jgi:hypothetical protein